MGASRVRGFLSLTFGAIGSLLSVAAAVASIVFIVGANNIVDDVEDRITRPVTLAGSGRRE